MKGEDFVGVKLPLGISIDNLDGLAEAYQATSSGVVAWLSCENILKFVNSCVEGFDEPLFFFVELACSEDEENQLRKSEQDPFHYNLYYLDNCTKEVIFAIIQRYGDLLVNDGIVRFGFGCHNVETEIYIRSYKVIDFYCGQASQVERAKKMLETLGSKRVDELVTPMDILSKENSGNCSVVEFDGETVFDIPENLEDEGMYLADTIV